MVLVLVCAVNSSWAGVASLPAAADTTVRQEKTVKQSKRHRRMVADSLVRLQEIVEPQTEPGAGARPMAQDTTTSPKKSRNRGKLTTTAQEDTVATATKPVEEEIGSLEKEWPKVIFKHYVGVKGGYGMGSGRFEPTRQNELHLGLYNFGVMYMFDAVSKGNKYVGAVQFELEYLQKGFTYHLYRDSEEVYSRNYAVIQLPILWQPYLPLSRNGYSRFFISAGPFVNYIVDTGSERRYNKETGQTYSAGPYKWSPLRDNRFEYGITAGAGFKIGIKRFAVVAEFRYNITFSDLMKGVEKYPENTFFRSPIDQMNVSLMLVYRLTK